MTPLLRGLQRHVAPWLDLAGRFYLGGVFIYAAWGKILDPGEFAISIATYQILPLVLINFMAVVLPWLELFTGIGLIVGFRTKAMALCINGMMVMFITAIIIALSKDIKMQCGCFASEEAQHDLTLGTVFRDLGWLAIGLYIMLGNRNRISLDELIEYLKRKKAPRAEDDRTGG